MSAIRSILLHVDASPHSESRLVLALSLAARLDATITALYGADSSDAEGRSFSYSAAAAVLRAEQEEIRRERVREALGRHLPVDGPTIRWADLRGPSPSEGFVKEAAYADLLILGQSDPESCGAGGAPAGFVETVVLHGGRPALVVPKRGAGSGHARRVLIAWNGSAQAARAVTGSLPLLGLADHVEVISWARNPLAAPSGSIDIGEFLARHGIEARVRRLPPTNDVGAELARELSATSADLLVMGCYGHTRLHERVLGGASRAVFEAMSVSTLMAH